MILTKICLYKKTILMLILIIGLVLLFIWSFFIEPNKLVVTKYLISDNDLKGIKVVFVSDFHINPYQNKRLKKVIALVNAQNPDIVLSGGDFISGHLASMTMPIGDIAKELQNINAKYGFYTAIGNHDKYLGEDYAIKELRKNKINVLYNSNTKVNIKGKDVYIAGIEFKPNNTVPIVEALKNTKAPVIMLTHSPDEIKKIPDSVNLILAGHTHGGQVVLPFVGALFTASDYKDKYIYGFIEEENKKMIVTNGIGVSILPFRFNCVPEIVVIEFK